MFAKNLSRYDLILGAVAAAAVLLSGLAMNRLSLGASNMASLGAASAGQAELVSQNALAPDARTDMPAITAAACPISLELMDEGNAMLGGTLLAPCLPNQDLVIAHAGLVYSAQTLTSGALFFSLPALKADAQVDIRFTNGETASARLQIPDAAQVQRLVVQWPHKDGFSIHAFENGAGFDDKGHVWAQNTNAPTADNLAAANGQAGGYLTLLGDAQVEMPLMAQVYTYPAAGTPNIILEAAVTDETCTLGELMGEVLTAGSSAVQTADITLAMPDCDAVGEFVQMALPPMPVDLAMVN